MSRAFRRALDHARDLLRARPGWVLATGAALTLALGALAPFTRWDSDPDLLTIEGSPELRAYRDYLARFGSDELIIIAFEHPRLLEPDGLALVRALGDALFGIEGVEDVASLDGAYEVDVGPFGPFARPLIPDDLAQAPPPDALLASLRALPMARDTLVDRTGMATSLVVKPQVRSLGGEARRSQRQLLDDVEAVLARAEFASLDLHVAGSPVFNRELERLNTRDNALFTPLAAMLVAVLLIASLRQLLPVVLAMACVLGTLAWVRGAMTALDVPLNTTTSLLPPLLLVLGVTVSIHVLARYQRERSAGMSASDAVRVSEEAVFAPAALAALTTAVGFGSLWVSSIPSIRIFGAFAALGSAAAFLLGAVVLPAALRVLAPPGRAGGGGTWMDEVVVLLSRTAARHPREVLVAALGLAVFAALAIPSLSVATHDGGFFPDDHPLNQAYDFIEARLSGVTPLELIVEAEQPQGIRDVRALALLDALQDRLESLPETVRGVSIADWIRLAHDSLAVPEGGGRPLDPAGLERAAFVLEAVSGEDLPYWIQDDWSVARIASRSVALDSAQNDRLLARLESTADELLRELPGYRIVVTGLVPVFARMEEALLASQIQSFALALVCIFGVFLMLFRSPRAACIAMIPNLLPIALTLGLMGVLGIPLDVVTVMVASVNLGIIVDDTIHVMHAYRSARRQGLPGAAAIDASLRRTGRAVVTTSFVLSLGFASLALSDFQPTAHFGGLTALTVASALLADLLLLPVLLDVALPEPAGEALQDGIA